MLDAAKIYRVYKDKGYKVDVGEDVYNICYIEDLNTDGTPHPHIPNQFGDSRILWQALPDGTAKIAGVWEATTRPSAYWTIHPMNSSGAFNIALGQQTCWTMGQYHDQTALIQTEPIRGTRDYNRDYRREGDTAYPPGLYGVHHHWGYNYPHDDLGRSSAGCQVGRTTDGHTQFIKLLKQDHRYKADRKHVWTSTVITAFDYSNASAKPISTGAVPAVLAGTVIAGAATGVASPSLGWSTLGVIIASVAFLGLLGGILWAVYKYKWGSK